MPKIDYTRPEVARQIPRWQQIRDCLAGQDVIKSKTTLYLPKPNADDKSAENAARYTAYVLRAMFMNATGGTCEGLVGEVFRSDPVVEVPPSMDLLKEDADGHGVTLVQKARTAVRETLALGRCGAWVDYPKAAVDDDGKPRAFTRAEIQDGSARPFMLHFEPERILNWRYRLVRGKPHLCLVVLSCDYIAEDDGFAITLDEEYRVLLLDAEDQYVVQTWRKNLDPATKTAEPFILYDVAYPTDYAGARLQVIPFTFIGATNNNAEPDKPPMLDLSNVNIAHYRNSADYEDSVYMVGQPTPVVTGLSQAWVKEVFKDQPIRLGSRAAVPLPQGAALALVAAEANGLVKEAMQDKERQMAALGAQLVEQKEVQRTLGEAQMEKAVTTSILVQTAKNVAAAYTMVLGWCAMFYGEDPLKCSIVLSTDFAISRLPPAERDQLMKEWQAGAISFTEMRAILRQSGIATLDDAAAKAEIEVEMQSRMDMAMEEAAAAAGAEGTEEEDDGTAE
jgi:hypothetical protein